MYAVKQRNSSSKLMNREKNAKFKRPLLMVSGKCKWRKKAIS